MIKKFILLILNFVLNINLYHLLKIKKICLFSYIFIPYKEMVFKILLKWLNFKLKNKYFKF